MSGLLSLWRRGGDRRLSAAEERRLDLRVDQIIGRFPPTLNGAQRKRHLENFVAHQSDVAVQLLSRLGIETLNDHALQVIWADFLKRRRRVRRMMALKGPLRLGVPAALRAYRDDEATLTMLEAIAGVLAMRLLAEKRTLRWSLEDHNEKLLTEGVPVLRGFSGDFGAMSPAQVVLNIAAQATNNEDTARLVAVFRYWRDGERVSPEESRL